MEPNFFNYHSKGWRGIKKYLRKCYEEDCLKAGEVVDLSNMKDMTPKKVSRRKISLYINNVKVRNVAVNIFICNFLKPRKCPELQACPTASPI